MQYYNCVIRVVLL